MTNSPLPNLRSFSESGLTASDAMEPPMHTRAARRDILNTTQTPAADSRLEKNCVHEWFESQVEQHPETEALIVGSVRLNYRELNERANQLAHHLRSIGVESETLVGIFLERSVEMVVAILGVLKAGGAYLPLDPVYPKERLAHMLADAQATVVLTQNSLKGVLNEIKPLASRAIEICCVDTDDQIGSAKTSNLGRLVQEHNLAYVIYTSGSTGKPKGVALEHRNAVAFINWASQVYSPHELNGVMAATSICFDLSILDLLAPLCLGGKVILAANTLVLSELEAAQEVRLLVSVPSVVRELLRIGKIPTSLETINMGGEILPDKLVKEVYALPHIKRVYNLYGPTETTTNSTFALRTVGGSNTIGKPITGTQVYILDSNQNPVNQGEIGEIFIGGQGVARGYIHQPEITEKKFIRAHFINESVARIYRTGDLGRQLPDGNIEFLGRNDRQVKIRGFRVELGEIETALLRHEEISEAAVIARDENSEKKGLIAYVVPAINVRMKRQKTQEETKTEIISSLRFHLKSLLPDYMLPGTFVVLGGFPLTPSGKVNYAALPVPQRTRLAAEEYAPPKGTNEEVICQIWSELLNIKPIGVDEDFFHLGGDSLQGVVMFTEIEKRLGVKLPLEAILRNPTVAGLASYINKENNQRKHCVESPWVEIQPKGTRPKLFLVHGVGGGMMWGYANLSRHLGEDQPIYAFRANPVESRSITAMAKAYVSDLRAFQPEGPYLLGGYCFGGIVAYEMACILEAQGQKVDYLVLFNSSPPNCSYDCMDLTPVFVGRFLLNVGHWLTGFVQWERRRQLRFIRWKSQMLKRRLMKKLLREKIKDAGLEVERQIDLSLVEPENRALWTAHVEANSKHHSGTYNGKLTLLRTLGHPFNSNFDPLCGWKDFAKGVISVKVLPGLHESLLENAHIELVAQEVKAHIDGLTVRSNAL